jgi:hypothetical protein
MPNWKKIIVSGSDASLNTLTVSNGITGSLFGTASYISPTFISSSAAASGFSVSIANNTDNYIVTATGTSGSLNGESTLTYNGTTLGVGVTTPYASVKTHINGILGIENGSTGGTLADQLLFGYASSGLTQYNHKIQTSHDSQPVLNKMDFLVSNGASTFLNVLTLRSLGLSRFNSGQGLGVSGSFQVTGSAIMSGSLDVIGNTTMTGSLNITGSSTITNGALILSSSAISTYVLRTAGDSIAMIDNYGLASRSYLRIGTNGISIHNAGGDPTITCPIGMNLNSSATIYSSATSHIFYGGTNKQVSIGTAAVPTAKLHIAAGAAAATSAPIKLTAGTNMTTPEEGAVEFDGTNLFFTTGSTRQITVAATSALTSSRIPYATTNGRLIDSANLTYGATANTLHVEGGSGNILFELTRAGEITYKYNIDSSNTLNITTSTGDTSYYFLRGNKFGIGINATARLHVVGGTATANTAPIKFTAGTNLTTPEAGTIEFDGNSLFFTTGSTRSTVLTNISPASITGNLVVTGSLLVSGSVRLNGNAGVNITGNTVITGSLLVSGSSVVAGFNPIPLAGTIQDGVTSVLGSLNDWNSSYYQGDVLYSETAGATITFGQLCYRTQTNTWELADATAANSVAAFNMLGICVKSSTATNPTSILINGFVETATYAAVVKSGEPLYMATTAGSMTKTAPTTVGNAVRLIGNTFWSSNTNTKIIIRFNPESSWIEL